MTRSPPATLGPAPQGELDRRIGELVGRLGEAAAAGRWPLAALVRSDADIAPAEAALADLGLGARTLVFLGDGAAALTAETMAQLAGWSIPGGGDAGQLRRPRTRFYDTVDPHSLTAALAPERLAEARFIVLDPTGAAPVPRAQAEAVLAGLTAAVLTDFSGRLLGVVPDSGGPLAALLAERGAPILTSGTDLGTAGVLAMPGLLAAMARGRDARAVRSGAAAAFSALAGRPAERSETARAAAATASLLCGAGLSAIEVVACADRLRRLADWLAATWADALGVGHRGGSRVLVGGAEQPALVLLLTLGPGDAGATPVGRIAAEAQAARVADIAAEAAAAGHHVRAIHIPGLDEATIGGLLMQLLLEAILCGRLLAGGRG